MGTELFLPNLWCCVTLTGAFNLASAIMMNGAQHGSTQYGVHACLITLALAFEPQQNI
jgi:hypothetical protein